MCYALLSHVLHVELGTTVARRVALVEALRSLVTSVDRPMDLSQSQGVSCRALICLLTRSLLCPGPHLLVLVAVQVEFTVAQVTPGAEVQLRLHLTSALPEPLPLTAASVTVALHAETTAHAMTDPSVPVITMDRSLEDTAALLLAPNTRQTLAFTARAPAPGTLHVRSLSSSSLSPSLPLLSASWWSRWRRCA